MGQGCLSQGDNTSTHKVDIAHHLYYLALKGTAKEALETAFMALKISKRTNSKALPEPTQYSQRGQRISNPFYHRGYLWEVLRTYLLDITVCGCGSKYQTSTRRWQGTKRQTHEWLYEPSYQSYVESCPSMTLSLICNNFFVSTKLSEKSI